MLLRWRGFFPCALPHDAFGFQLHLCDQAGLQFFVRSLVLWLLLAATRLLRVWLVVPPVLRTILYQHSAVRTPIFGLLAEKLTAEKKGAKRSDKTSKGSWWSASKTSAAARD